MFRSYYLIAHAHSARPGVMVDCVWLIAVDQFLICICVYIYPYICSHVGSSALMFQCLEDVYTELCFGCAFGQVEKKRSKEQLYAELCSGV